MSAIIIQDETVHYEALGRGKPLIFLHGWVGSWRYWAGAMQAAAISYRTYALDLWGFGDTAKNSSFYHIEQQINLLEAFHQEMGMGKIALVGHGLGALVAALYAIRSPRWVDRLMAVSLPVGVQRLNGRLTNTRPAELADWLLGSVPGSELARQETAKSDALAVQLSLAHLQALDMHKILAALQTPCLLVYGQDDPLLDRTAGWEAFGILPEHIHPVLLEDSGHFPMLDESPKFHRLMADFLALASGESPRSLQLKEEWKRRIR